MTATVCILANQFKKLWKQNVNHDFFVSLREEEHNNKILSGEQILYKFDIESKLPRQQKQMFTAEGNQLTWSLVGRKDSRWVKNAEA